MSWTSIKPHDKPRKHSLDSVVPRDDSHGHRSLTNTFSRHSVRSTVKSVRSVESSHTGSDVKLVQTEPMYPPVRPTANRKREVFRTEDYTLVDAHAAQAPRGVSHDDATLIKYLMEQTHDSDLARVRSIFRWLVGQTPPELHTKDPPSPGGPAAYLYALHTKKLGSYAELFARLSRQANIPCVVVPGLGKSVAYEVGEALNTRTLRNKWNAVYVAGSWRLIHPYWAAHSARGFNTGRWAIVESCDWHKQDHKAELHMDVTVNEFFFLTDPDQFITKCFPDSPKWQLLKKPFNISQFQKTAYYQPSYFVLELEEVGPKQCILHANSGKVELQFMMKEHNAHRLNFSYKLYKLRDPEDEGEYDVTPLDRYVLHYYRHMCVVFEMRFPITGHFKLELFCGDSENPLPSNWIVDYRIVCNKPMVNCAPLPILPDIGWGPRAPMSEAGIDACSHKEGLVCLDSAYTTELCFRARTRTDIKTKLLSHSVPEEEMTGSVSVEEENGDIIVNVTPPCPGEYALQILARSENTDTHVNVCNYILQRNKDVEAPLLAEKREALERAISEGGEEELQKALEEFEEQAVEDHGEVKRAKHQLFLLRLNTELRRAITAHDLAGLESACSEAVKAGVEMELEPTFQEAELMVDKLRRFKVLRHAVLDMSQKTISELRSYSKPPSVIHGVMAATFILLGHKEQELKKWSTVKSLIGKTGKQSLKRRVAALDIRTVPPSLQARAREILSQWDLETVQLASAGAATFHQWATTSLGKGTS